MPPFECTNAYAALKARAANPLDLTLPDAITPKRLHHMAVKSAGLHLLYGFQRVTPEVISDLCALATERNVHHCMEALQQGEVVNYIECHESEERPALHTALRAQFGKKISPTADLAAQKAATELEKLKKYMEATTFREMIFVGMGGSELGPRALYYALSSLHRKDRKVHFLTNVDPSAVAQILAEADLPNTCVVIISKSGSTLETATNDAFLRAEFEKRGLTPRRHFIGVTMPNSLMDNKDLYHELFYIWDYIGGRYSATSMVGGVLLAFAVGYDHFMEILRGAHDMDQCALEQDPHANMPLMGALLGIWNRNFLNYPTCAIIPYSQALWRFPAHLQQCDMESNGKRIDKAGRVVPFATGPIIWGEPGTSAQHSFFQLLHQGTDVVPLDLIGFADSTWGEDFVYHGTTSQEKLLANLIAQAIALAEGQINYNPNKVFPGNRPSSIILGKRLSPYSLGALLAYYEHRVAFQGFIWGINSFDQEGVQLGKHLADRVLKLFAARRTKQVAEPFPLGDAFVDVVEGL